MRIRLGKKPGMRLNYDFAGRIPAVVYPRMYCPLCGSLNIDLKQLSDSEPIWECWDCAADFRLTFPLRRRF